MKRKAAHVSQQIRDAMEKGDNQLGQELFKNIMDLEHSRKALKKNGQ
jgi:hypothetical protein